jgi:hypothetical protein
VANEPSIPTGSALVDLVIKAVFNTDEVAKLLSDIVALEAAHAGPDILGRGEALDALIPGIAVGGNRLDSYRKLDGNLVLDAVLVFSPLDPETESRSARLFRQEGESDLLGRARGNVYGSITPE